MKAVVIAIGAILLPFAANAQSVDTTRNVGAPANAPTIQEKVLGQNGVQPATTTGSGIGGSAMPNKMRCREITVRTPQPGAVTVIRKFYDCD